MKHRKKHQERMNVSFIFLKKKEKKMYQRIILKKEVI